MPGLACAGIDLQVLGQAQGDRHCFPVERIDEVTPSIVSTDSGLPRDGGSTATFARAGHVRVNP